jgi:hypothetical protein
MNRHTALTALALVLTTASLTAAQDTIQGDTANGLPEFAAFFGDTLLRFEYADGTLTDTGDVPTVPNRFMSPRPMKWSPDGSQLVFSAPTDSGTLSLYSVAVGGAPVLLTENAFDGTTFDISPDGQSVVYARVTGESSAEYIPFDILSVPIEGGASEVVGTAGFGAGCGGGSLFPGDTMLWRDTHGIGSPGFFELTASGLVYGDVCAGLLRADLQTGFVLPLGPNYSGAVLSDDGTKIAARMYDEGSSSFRPVVIHLETGETTFLTTAQQPERLAWGPTGELFYTTQEDTGVIVPGTDGEAFANQGFIGGMPVYEVAIHRLTLSPLSDEEILRVPGYTISRLDVAPDNSAIFFTTVPNGEAWADAVMNQGDIEDFVPYFPLALSRFDLASGAVDVLAPDLWSVTLNDAAFN